MRQAVELGEESELTHANCHANKAPAHQFDNRQCWDKQMPTIPRAGKQLWCAPAGGGLVSGRLSDEGEEDTFCFEVKIFRLFFKKPTNYPSINASLVQQ